MHSDSLVRVLLALILLSLLVIAAQGFGIEIGGQEEAPAPAQEVIGEPMGQRFQVDVLRTRSGPMFTRTDTATGRMWRTPVSGTEDWSELGTGLVLESGEPLRPGRFVITVLRSKYGPFFVRVDQKTGRLWQMPLSGKQPWMVVGEGEEGAESAGDAAPIPEDVPEDVPDWPASPASEPD